MWNTSELLVKTFAAASTPSCKVFMCLWQCLSECEKQHLYDGPAQSHSSHSYIPPAVVGLTVVPDDDTMVAVTTASGDLFYVDLLLRRVVPFRAAPRLWPKGKDAPVIEGSQATTKPPAAATVETRNVSAPPCIAALSSHFGHPNIGFVPIQGTGTVSVVSFGTREAMDRFHLKSSSSSSSSRSSSSSSSSEHYANGFVKSPSMSLTLPGCIFSAEPGNQDILTTRDLRDFLCSQAVAHSCPYRTETLYVDWAYSAPEEGDFGTARKGFYCIVNSVGLCSLRLDSPYAGPTVVNGLPKVILRAALMPRGKPAVSPVQSGVVASSGTASRTVEHSLGIIKVRDNCSITALATHSTQAYLVTGLLDDSIVVVSPVILQSDEEEN